jgi:hypothetical protein
VTSRALGRRSRACALFALFAVASSSSAQRVIRVVSHDQPIPNVEVSVWSENARLAATRTDYDGIAHLQLPASSPLATVLVRRLGYAPARRALGSADTLVVSLIETATDLPVVAVASKSLACPHGSEPTADSIWTSAAAMYSSGISSLRLKWAGTLLQETVASDQRGYGDGTPANGEWFGAVLPDTASITMRTPPPYARYERHIGLGGEYWRWRYAPLHDFAAEHFVSPTFRERHTFQVLGRSDGATIVGFCPKQRDDAEVKGELLIGDDHLLRGARWFVQLSHDDEDAGGEATFVATPFDGHVYVVAIRGSTWRRAGKNLYNQDRFERSSWSLSR